LAPAGAVVNDRENRTAHELDIVALSRARGRFDHRSKRAKKAL
jgi:hypothetical protein